jgi:OPA family glycerol-3-phosphate transporter-like MFS transporter
VQDSEDRRSTDSNYFRSWQQRVLFTYTFFYLFVYMGRFNHWPTGPLIREDLAFSHVEIGIINACLLWGFAIGDMTHGRLAELYGYRLLLLVGAIGSVALNWVTSFGTSLATIAIPWALNGFVNATAWSPGIGMLAQWWERQHRGRVMGLVGVSAGTAMLVMWLVTGWTAGEFGWRAAFRYPPLLMIPAALILFWRVRDRPSDIELPELANESIGPDTNTSHPEPAERIEGSRSTTSESFLTPYKTLMSDWRFVATSHIKGLENVVRYGLTTWAPLYYFEEAGLSIESTALVTVAIPVGYLTAPLVSGWISDVLLGGRRSPMVAASALISAGALLGLALVPATNLYAGAALLFIGAFAMSMSMTATLVVDLAGKKYAGTASGVLDGHGYVYAGAQAIIFAIFLDAAGAPWEWVFLGMAAVRILSAVMAWRVRL